MIKKLCFVYAVFDDSSQDIHYLLNLDDSTAVDDLQFCAWGAYSIKRLRLASVCIE